MSNGSPTCSVWDASKQDWSSDGCVMINVTANTVKCACNQLGIFGFLVVSSVCLCMCVCASVHACVCVHASNNTLQPIGIQVIIIVQLSVGKIIIITLTHLY